MNSIYDFIEDESGLGVIEVVLILVVIIGLVLIFKSRIQGILKKIFKEIDVKIKEIY